MKLITEVNNSQGINKLHDIENNNNIVKAEESMKLINAPFITDECCGKMCVAFTFTALLCPFAICDVYYASTDTSCVNQDCNGLAINMRSYLLASGIIVFIGIGIANFSIFCLDYKMFESKKYYDEQSDSIQLFNLLLNWVSRLFGISWVITGCVLFWAYMDISKCNTSIKSYLFARFIIFLISTVMTMNRNKE